MIAIFVIKDIPETMEKICRLFKKSKYINRRFKNDIAIVLDWMVKKHFEGDEEKIMELIDMIKEERDAARRGMRIYYEEEFAQLDAEHTKELAQKEAEHIKEMTKKETELYEKNEEIARLKAKLKENGIE